MSRRTTAKLGPNAIRNIGGYRYVYYGMAIVGTGIILYQLVNVAFLNLIDVLLVAECHRLEREDRFARVLHRLDLFLVPPRGGKRPQLVVSIDINRAFTRNRKVNIADPSGTVYAGSARDTLTDADVGVARDEPSGEKSSA
jgi:hypothetical protein